ncbi:MULTISPECIES: FKBP-type peptidyl-prolyl cis-trans isomerase [Pontibacter]|uniref:Peptidyl-prolyl cis-trans isomerase n=1 Tax=Pontibacter lucknowensis TaxID=1077936 RepID=A0A1N6U155_9BACT|nr:MULTISPECIES: FKBP-type peptidyl-prolyl cis-trans isomerase [Pontibacter]EJF07918.1 FKBP-type peptidyl-prolyl cis-trans isomerase [Pontibacter sp. BAB1700]SIQ59314.1 peptidylprolyl isomerase [Pontibacter lucknowensis]
MNLTHKKQKLSTWFAKALFLFVVLVSFASCKEDNRNPYYVTPEQIEAQKKIDEETIRKYFRTNNVDTTKVVRLNSGLYILTKKEGEGDKIKAGQYAEVNYIGRNISNDVFDSSFRTGKPFSVLVGAGQVIKGWDEGLQQLRKGEEANLYIPSYLGYGYYGSNSIPPNSVLIFEIDVLQVR